MNNGKKNNSLENVIVKPTKDYETVGVKTKKKKQTKVKRKKKRKNILKKIIIILIIIVVILCVISVFLIKDDKLDIYIGNSKLKYTTTNNYDNVYITDVSEVVEDVMPSIVSVTIKPIIDNESYNSDYSKYEYNNGNASGIIIGKSEDELMILTNNHVISNSQEISVGFINEKKIKATVKGISSENDIAVLSIKLDELDQKTLNTIKVATIGYSKDLKVGNGVIAIGNALGYGQSVTTGVVSALDREVVIDGYPYKMIQIDAAINPGNSGGALLNSKGEVIGINSFKYSSNNENSYSNIEGMSFAIPISDISNVITELMDGKDENSGLDLGIEGYIINEENSSFYNMPIGFYISKIVPNSIAAKSKLEIGNIIVEADGKQILKYDDFKEVLSNKSKNDKIKFKLMYLSDTEYKEKIIEISI